MQSLLGARWKWDVEKSWSWRARHAGGTVTGLDADAAFLTPSIVWTMKLTPELLAQASSSINPVKERQLDLRGTSTENSHRDC